MSIPATMSAVFQDAASRPLQVRTCPVPQPKPGQVLVKMAASPINPSDLSFLEGTYKFTRPYPAIPGLEGSGTVVANGGGFMGNLVMGKRVACSSVPSEGGTWAEYMVTQANLCIPLQADLSMEQGAMLLVNPLTAMAMIEMAQKGGHASIVNSAGASALGKMLIRLGKQAGIGVVPVVRRAEQVQELTALGATHVLNTSDPDFDKQYRATTKSEKATLILDAVGGKLTFRLLQGAPSRSVLVLYGGLANEPTSFHPGSLIFEKKRIQGFYLTDWLGSKNLLQTLRITQKVQQLLKSGSLQSQVKQRFPLADAQQGLEAYRAEMSGGKVLFVMGE